MINYFLILQRAVSGIVAHDTPLAAVAFNPSGTKLATASTTVCISYDSIIFNSISLAYNDITALKLLPTSWEAPFHWGEGGGAASTVIICLSIGR